MTHRKHRATVTELEGLMEAATPGPWWDSHGQPAAGDKSLWDEWEAFDVHDPDASEPWDNGRKWTLLFGGDAENEADTALLVAAVNALPALLKVVRYAHELNIALYMRETPEFVEGSRKRLLVALGEMPL